MHVFRDEKFQISDEITLETVISEIRFKEYLKLIKTQFQKCSEAIDNMEKLKNIRSDKNVSDVEFYNMYNQLFSVFTKDKDFEFIKKYSKEFLDSEGIKTSIKTDIPTEWTEQEGRGRDFSWWTVRGFTSYDVLFADNDKFNPEKIYTKEGLFELIKSRAMIIIKPNGIHLNISEEIYEEKKVSGPEYIILIPDYFGRLFENKQIDSSTLEQFLDYYPDFIQFIRKDISDKYIDKNLKKLKASIEKTAHNIINTCNFEKSEHQAIIDRYDIINNVCEVKTDKILSKKRSSAIN